jgi:hypothetical protein
MPRKPTDTIQVNLRIKEALRRRLEVAAKKRDVSLNFEMVDRLKASFDQDAHRTIDEAASRIDLVATRIKRAENLLRYAAKVESQILQEELMDAAEEDIKHRDQATIERVQKAIAAIANKFGRMKPDREEENNES